MDNGEQHSFTVTVTERCQSKCTYCHFFSGSRPREDYQRDISPELFDVYMLFIKKWREEVNPAASYRFSGGDPLVLGDRLFVLSQQAYDIVGVKHYLLTNGSALDASIVEKAKKSSISHFYVSLENPLSPGP